jgi:uncharacterized protein (UPF0332 family)
LTLHHDLLEQARHLAKRETRRPRQASLRRAVSAAYYALFHLLAAEGAAIMTRGGKLALRAQVQRAFAHNDMKRICQHFAKGGLPEPIRSLIISPLEPELMSVAKAFIDLQEQRHAADYDTQREFDRVTALDLVDSAQSAFADWAAVRSTPNAAAFLTALLLNRQWGRA